MQHSPDFLIVGHPSSGLTHTCCDALRLHELRSELDKELIAQRMFGVSILHLIGENNDALGSPFLVPAQRLEPVFREAYGLTDKLVSEALEVRRTLRVCLIGAWNVFEIQGISKRIQQNGIELETHHFAFIIWPSPASLFRNAESSEQHP